MEMLGTNHAAKVLILCGGGNNGGDGLAIARHLHNRGAEVSLAFTVDAIKYIGDALTNWRIVSAMKLPWKPANPDEIATTRAQLIIDAVFGTGLEKPPREPFGAIVQAVESSRVPVLAIDLPSGLDCDTGKPLGPKCFTATQTITFVAEKIGFGNAEARNYLGKVSVGSIGCPIELIDQISGSAEQFSQQ
jgi:NAD(P)H-hydrate epimerase